MKKNIIATLVGFIVTFLSNTIFAMTIIGPYLNAKIGISRNPEKEGLNFPSILLGYLLLTVVLVWLVSIVKGKTWLHKGLIAGAMIGLAVNIAGHLITAGWSIADSISMLFSGIIDSFATILGAVAIAYILKNRETK